MPSPFDVFLEPAALAINEARQAHLATLGIDLIGKRVLEVGAGIGLHTAFFESRGCDILSVDGNPANVAEMIRRYPARKLGLLDLDRPADLTSLGSFDIVYCYGTLYHLSDPGGALKRLAAICRGQLLLETMVALGDHPELHYAIEPPTANQALHGIGARPTRAWVMAALSRYFGHAYTTRNQPDFPDFERDWRRTRSGGNLRAIFVGSKIPLDLPTLSGALLERHDNAMEAMRTPVPERVWIDIGAYQGGALRQAALDDAGLVIHAFEPNPALFETLNGGPDNYVPHAAAIAGHDGFARLRLNSFPAASSLLGLDEAQRRRWVGGDLLAEQREIVVPTIRLDSFMAEVGIRTVEYLKIDAQGSEFDAIRSLGDRLRDVGKITAKVAVTEHQLYAGAADKATMVAYLAAKGFRLTNAEPQSHHQEENLTFERY